MPNNLMTTGELRGMRVLGGKKGTKRIGKIRRFVFHPRERRIVGFIVKRPDLLWMFHRKDLFVSLQGYDMVDGRAVVRTFPGATGKGACKALGIDWNACVLWEGMPLLTESGDQLGVVGDVSFDGETGAIASVLADAGATANTLLGTRRIPSSLIKGFRRGAGVALAASGDAGAEQEEEEVEYGAILVSDEARDIPAEGSVAEKAGAATAVAVDKVSRTATSAAKSATEAVGKGARALGKRAGETKDAFSEFKEEYDKARVSTEGGSSRSSAKDAGRPSAKAPAKQAASKKKPGYATMFSSFKEEYDKARHGDE